MSNGELTQSFFESGGIEAEGNLDTASKISEATQQSITSTPTPPSSGGPGKLGL